MDFGPPPEGAKASRKSGGVAEGVQKALHHELTPAEKSLPGGSAAKAKDKAKAKAKEAALGRTVRFGGARRTPKSAPPQMERKSLVKLGESPPSLRATRRVALCDGAPLEHGRALRPARAERRSLGLI